MNDWAPDFIYLQRSKNIGDNDHTWCDISVIDEFDETEEQKYIRADIYLELQAELASMTRMFQSACIDLGLINDALGLDSDDGGAEPILSALEELRSTSQSPVALVLSDLEILESLSYKLSHHSGDGLHAYISCQHWYADAEELIAAGRALLANVRT